MKSITNLCNRIPNLNENKIMEFITNYNNVPPADKSVVYDPKPNNAKLEIVDEFIEYIGGFKESVLEHIYHCFNTYKPSDSIDFKFGVEVRTRLQDYAIPDDEYED